MPICVCVAYRLAYLPMSAHSIVLENLSHPFLKPNILDIKLGTVLHDDSASEEKRARMIKTAKETTSFETGIRLTGFKVSMLVLHRPYHLTFSRYTISREASRSTHRSRTASL